MNDIKKRIHTLEQKHVQSREQFAVVFKKSDDETLYNTDGTVYNGTARTRIVFDWAIRDL
jgi:hypothetical protein